MEFEKHISGHPEDKMLMKFGEMSKKKVYTTALINKPEYLVCSACLMMKGKCKCGNKVYLSMCKICLEVGCVCKF